MHPICFTLGSFTVHWYGVLMACGFLAALLHWIMLARRENLNTQFCSDLLFWIMIGGVIGGRLAYVISDAAYYLRHPLEIIRIDKGGLIFYGGTIGVLVALILFARSRKIRISWLADFVASAAPLGHALGRIGCFMNGCCFGKPYDGIPSVTFPGGSPPWLRQQATGLLDSQALQSLPVHPVQLYEVAWNLLVYVVLLVAYRRRHRGGTVFAMYFMLYPLGRFVTETLRGTPRLFWGPMSAAQAISLVMIITGIVLFVMTHNSLERATRETSPPTPDAE